MSPHRAAASLQGQQVHLWRWFLQPLAAEDQPYAVALSADEQRRADAFSSALDRRRYVTAHAFLRHLLAHYVDVAPHELQFDTAAGGKPSCGV